MGYYTKFDLEVTKFDDSKPMCGHIFDTELCPECGLNSIIKPDEFYNHLISTKFSDYGIDDGDKLGYVFEDGCKWYECNEDMITISKKFPNVLFQLDGNGEEDGDLWRNFFLNGNVQCTQVDIVYEEFDINKMIVQKLKGK